MKKRFLSIALCVCMVLSLLPTAALAAETQPVQPTEEAAPSAQAEESPAAEVSPSAEPSPSAAAEQTVSLMATGDPVDYTGQTEAGNYTISTAAQLAKLAAMVNAGTTYSGSSFTLTENIDLSKTDSSGELNWTGGTDWTPIGAYTVSYGSGGSKSLSVEPLEEAQAELFASGGDGSMTFTASAAFSGSFDGGDHTVSSITITDNETSTMSLGLFGCTDSAAIKGLNVSGVYTPTYNSDARTRSVLSGGLVSYAKNTSFENCSSSVTLAAFTISGNTAAPIYAGGIAALAEGDCAFTDCKNTGSVSAAEGAGGIVSVVVTSLMDMDAANSDSSITSCENSGAISSGGDEIGAGGIVGMFAGKTISGCTNTADGSVTASSYGKSAGIAASVSGGSVSGCNNAGVVSGNNYCNIGGIVSYLTNGSVSDCTNSAAITGSSGTVGGIVTYSNNGSVSGCTNTAAITSSEDAAGIVSYLTNGSVSGCTNTAAVTSGGAAAGIVRTSENGSISGCTNSAAITGSYNVGGIVSYLNSGSISGCTNAAAVTGSSGTVGGIAAQANDGSISDCSNTAEICGSVWVGGIVGSFNANSPTDTMQDCVNSGSISEKTSNSKTSFGGLIGRLGSSGTMTLFNCSNSGDISAPNSQDVGGLVGTANCTGWSVQNSFNTGDVSGACRVGGIVGGNVYPGDTYNNNPSSSKASSLLRGGTTQEQLLSQYVIRNCFSTGALTEKTPQSSAACGGIIGMAALVTLDGCYYNGGSAVGMDYGNYLTSAGGSTLTGFAGSSAAMVLPCDTEKAYPLKNGSGDNNGQLVLNDDKATETTLVSELNTGAAAISGARPFAGNGADGASFADSKDVYTITFHSNGGVGNDYSQYVLKTAANSVVLTPNRFSKTAYAFDGWSTSAGAGAKKSYDNSATITQLSNNLDLYALWAPTYSTGTGSEKDPFIISSEADLKSFSQSVAAGNTYSGLYVRLDKDIEVTEDYLPIGSEDKVFSGSFDGNGKKITYNLLTDSTEYVGLFACIEGASIKDLTVAGTIDSSYTDHDIYVGGITGSSDYSTISRCVNRVEISADGGSGTYVGGIAGMANLSDGSVQLITCCSNEADISITNGNVGGIVGQSSYRTKAISCRNLGALSSSDSSGYVGGIVAENNSNAYITCCLGAGQVSGPSEQAGVIAGYSEGIIDSCVWMESYGDCVGTNDNRMTACESFTYDQLADGTLLDMLKLAAANSRTLPWEKLSSEDWPTLMDKADTVSITLNGNYTGSPAALTLYVPKAENSALLPNNIAEFSRTGAALSGWSKTSGGDADYEADGETKYTFTGGENLYAVWSNSWKGSGTEADPFLISTPEQLLMLADTVNTGDACREKYFKLTANINMAQMSWTGIGNNSNPFNGSLDGGGHAVNLFMVSSTAEYYGLFGYADYSSSISNVTVTGTLYGHEYVGGIAGRSNGTITNCVSKLDSFKPAASAQYVGGIAGYGSTIKDCSNESTVTAGSSYVGGVAGQGGSMYNCTNTGAVTAVGGSKVGGVTGYSSSMYNCTNTGAVTAGSGSNYVGGVTGYSNSSMYGCYSTGSVAGGDGSSAVGGLAGKSTSSMYGCYACGTVSGGSAPGLLVGEQYDVGWYSLNYCFYKQQGTLLALGNNPTKVEQNNVAAYSDKNTVSVTTYSISGTTVTKDGYTYNDVPLCDALNAGIDFSCLPFLPGGNGEPAAVFGTKDDAYKVTYKSVYRTGSSTTTSQCNQYMRKGASVPIILSSDGVLTRAGFTFTGFNTQESGGDPVAYPGSYTATADTTLYSQLKGVWSGSGTESDPYQIASKEDLDKLRGYVADGIDWSDTYFKQTADITLTSSGSTDNWDAIGQYQDNGNSNKAFAGYYDGNGKSISGIVDTDTDNLNCGGVFGYLTGTVKNLTVTDSTFTKTAYPAAIAAVSSGTIENCTVTGTVAISSTNSSSSCGAICALLLGGSVKDCVAGTESGNAVTVSGISYVGGLIGQSTGDTTVTGCKNYAAVTATKDNAGGIIGGDDKNDSTLTNCENHGSVSGAGNVGGIKGKDSGSSDYVAMKDCTNGGTVTGTGSYVGGIIGQSGCTSLTRCKNSGSITGYSNVGGIVGHAEDDIVDTSRKLSSVEITNCKNSGSVTTTNYTGTVGGIAGYHGRKENATRYFANISGCTNSGKVTAQAGSAAGGIVGKGSNCMVVRCTNSVEVIADDYVGGLAGWLCGSVTSCSNSGSISANETYYAPHSGGIVGILIGEEKGYVDCCVANSYNSGSVISNIGCACGIVGWMQASQHEGTFTGTTITENCYSSGTLTGNTKYGIAYNREHTTIKNCYWLEGTATDAAQDTSLITGCVTFSGTGDSCTLTSEGAAKLSDTLNLHLLDASESLPWVDGATYPVFKGTAETQAITYIANFDKVTGDKKYIQYETKENITQASIIENPFIHYAYTFTGWSKAPDGEADSTYKPGQTTDATGGALVLYAHWKKNWDGSGTEADPYKIVDAAGLEALSKDVRDGCSYGYSSSSLGYGMTYFSMPNDISYSAWTSGSTKPEKTWQPIGVDYCAFSGVFKGNEHTISGLYNDTSAYSGLFGSTAGALISDVTLADSYFKGSTAAGAIVAKISDQALDATNAKITYSSIVDNCRVASSVKVEGSKYVGGTVGVSDGSNLLINCVSAAKVYASSNSTVVGGILGIASGASANAQIFNCAVSGSVIMNSRDDCIIGGIVGQTSSVYNVGSNGVCTPYFTDIQNCSMTGTVGGSSGKVGRFVGKASDQTNITHCNGTFNENIPAVGNTSSKAVVSGSGELTVSELSAGAMNIDGALPWSGTGELYKLSECAKITLSGAGGTNYNGLMSSTDTPCRYVHKGTATKLGDNVFAKAGVKFTGWKLPDGSIGTEITASAPAAVSATWTTSSWTGKGTAAEPYQIKNADDLKQLAWDVNHGVNYSGTYFKQTQDISLSAVDNWTSIGGGKTKYAFSGIYDGDMHNITDLKCTAAANEYSVGLFGRTDGATIKNLAVRGTVSGSVAVGGVVGTAISSVLTTVDNQATVTTSSSKYISSGNYTGGVAGVMYCGSMTAVKNKGEISGYGNVTGGIAGYISGESSDNKAIVNNALNTGKVTNGTQALQFIVGSKGSNAEVTDPYTTTNGSDTTFKTYVDVDADAAVSTIFNYPKDTPTHASIKLGNKVGTAADAANAFAYADYTVSSSSTAFTQMTGITVKALDGSAAGPATLTLEISSAATTALTPCAGTGATPACSHVADGYASHYTGVAYIWYGGEVAGAVNVDIKVKNPKLPTAAFTAASVTASFEQYAYADAATSTKTAELSMSVTPGEDPTNEKMQCGEYSVSSSATRFVQVSGLSVSGLKVEGALKADEFKMSEAYTVYTANTPVDMGLQLTIQKYCTAKTVYIWRNGEPMKFGNAVVPVTIGKTVADPTAPSVTLTQASGANKDGTVQTDFAFSDADTKKLSDTVAITTTAGEATTTFNKKDFKITDSSNQTVTGVTIGSINSTSAGDVTLSILVSKSYVLSLMGQTSLSDAGYTPSTKPTLKLVYTDPTKYSNPDNSGSTSLLITLDVSIAAKTAPSVSLADSGDTTIAVNYTYAENNSSTDVYKTDKIVLTADNGDYSDYSFKAGDFFLSSTSDSYTVVPSITATNIYGGTSKYLEFKVSNKASVPATCYLFWDRDGDDTYYDKTVVKAGETAGAITFTKSVADKIKPTVSLGADNKLQVTFAGDATTASDSVDLDIDLGDYTDRNFTVSDFKFYTDETCATEATLASIESFDPATGKLTVAVSSEITETKFCYLRYKTSSDSSDTAMAGMIVVIPTSKQAAPAATIDYLNESLKNLEGSGDYTIKGTDITATSAGYVSIDESWFNSTASIVRRGNGVDLTASDPQNLEIPDRPAAPASSLFTVTQPTAADGTGLVKGITDKMQYSTDNGVSWHDGGSDVNAAIGALLVRYKSTASAFASKNQTITLKYTEPSNSGTTTTGGKAEPVIVDGVEHDIGTQEKSDTEITVTVDQPKLTDQISGAKDNVTVPVSNEKQSASAQLVVKNVEDMAAKDMTLTVTTGDVSYVMPTTAVDTASLMQKLGASDPTQVPVKITITRSGEETQAVVRENAEKTGVELVLQPVEFTFSASYSGKSVEITRFSQYVARDVKISAEDAKKITTAVISEPDGTLRHVPTYVYEKDGQWYARVNSLTNSVYALIYNDQTFADAAGKWYESVVSEMASRKVINGRTDGSFDGDASITRAEFSAILVRALGLPADGKSSFSDVKTTDWYSGAVGAASQYGLVTGYTDGSFAPNASITRQEAMAMVQRAAKVASYAGKTGELTAFSDAASVADWAKTAAQFNVGSGLIVGDNGALRPNDTITRAETATVVLRLLQKSGLVDVRSKT